MINLMNAYRVSPYSMCSLCIIATYMRYQFSTHIVLHIHTHDRMCTYHATYTCTPDMMCQYYTQVLEHIHACNTYDYCSYVISQIGCCIALYEALITHLYQFPDK